MPLLTILLACVVVIANVYAGWLGFPVWQSIAVFAFVHTIFRLGKRLILNSTNHHAQTDTAAQPAEAETSTSQSETHEEKDVDIPIVISMAGIYMVMLLVAAFWYAVGYGLSRLFG